MPGSSGLPTRKLAAAASKPLHHAIVIFLEHDQARERGTFLALITERGINRVDDRFVEVGIGIDDDGVLPAHLADDAFQFALARRAFCRRLPRSASPTSREPVKAIMSTSGDRPDARR